MSSSRINAASKDNATIACLDNHIADGRGNKVAYWYESDSAERLSITYEQLLELVCRIANVLKNSGVEKGDRVCLYMPSTPEAAAVMLACARIGATHTVVFAGFSEAALAERVRHAGCKAIVTADQFQRAGKTINLLERVRAVRPQCNTVETVFVVNSISSALQDNEVDLLAACESVPPKCDPEMVSPDHPLFILYTSGSTGKPKGVVHGTKGYIEYAAKTHRTSFDLGDDDVYWCVADIGWITGHSYLVYGPLANGTTSVLFSGVPSFPDAARHWEVVDRYKVTIYYSTPTIIRSLMRAGDTYLESTDRSSLRILGTVGEPINPEAWRWYFEKVGKGNCYIIDTWWQTETGGHIIASIPGTKLLKPGAAMKAPYGVTPHIFDEDGSEVTAPNTPGALVLEGEWSGKMLGLYNDEERYREVYLEPFPGYFTTGDTAYFDEDGDWWITGRIDDLLNISGRLIGTAEIESAIVSHPAAAEAAAVAGLDEVKGSSIHVFVLLIDGEEVGESIQIDLRNIVGKRIGSFAKPDYIHVVSGLPKTRSGKIMRRILRKIVAGEQTEFGDTSTLAEPEVVEELVEWWKNK